MTPCEAAVITAARSFRDMVSIEDWQDLLDAIAALDKEREGTVEVRRPAWIAKSSFTHDGYHVHLIERPSETFNGGCIIELTGRVPKPEPEPELSVDEAMAAVRQIWNAYGLDIPSTAGALDALERALARVKQP